MQLGVLVLLLLTCFGAWLAAFVLECYRRDPQLGLEEHPLNQRPPFPGTTPDNLFWFLQVSDIHLSIVNELAVAEDLRLFCTETISTIDPVLVLTTGDLTHAKFADELWSQQFAEEWKAYGDIMKETGVRDRLPWLDIRGNHDAFDVPSLTSEKNMFRRYAASYSTYGSHSYRYTHRTPFGDYSFIAMDACPSPGPRRPFNFFGILHDDDLVNLHSLASRPTLRPAPNHTVWFSHYPSATISCDQRRLRVLMAPAVAHLCGHLHDLVGLAPQLYGRQPSGHLELELGDFKSNRRYRLLAIDHDLFSFTDTRLREWPLVLITNPKDARFLVPGREPLGRMALSSHVRVLAFSPSGVKEVRVWLDGHPLPPATRDHSVPLWTTPWDPSQVAAGLHTITITAEDAAGNHGNASHYFSLDGSVAPLARLPQLLLLTDLRSLFQMLFLFVWISLLLGLAVAWINRAHSTFFQPLVRSRTIFYPLFGFLIYFGTGPWCVGEILTGEYGLISAHGLLVSGHFISGSVTYLYGFMQLCLWYVPLTFHLNHLLSLPPSRPRLFLLLLHHLTILSLFLFHCGWCVTFSPYGSVALVVSPGISWTIPFSLYLLLRAHRIRYRLTAII